MGFAQTHVITKQPAEAVFKQKPKPFGPACLQNFGQGDRLIAGPVVD
jgi:hypothetical protein